MKLDQAKELADKWVRFLTPSCERVEIAGSIRRGKAEPKDIEIVCKPRLTTELDLFGQPVGAINALEWFMPNIDHHGAYTIKDGPRYKQIALPEGIKLDLFIVLPPAEWGVIMTIRTGPSDFSHWLVTHKYSGGALPNNYLVHEGAIWNGSQKLETPEEIDLFRVLGLDYIEPRKRYARWAVRT